MLMLMLQSGNFLLLLMFLLFYIYFAQGYLLVSLNLGVLLSQCILYV